jgi:hypothetical protein
VLGRGGWGGEEERTDLARGALWCGTSDALIA